MGRLLLHLTSEQLCCWQWQRGVLTAGPCFDAARDGLTRFGNWLAGQQETPALLLVDIVEEDFQRHHLPHVPGRAGQALRARRLAQAWRDTPYRYALVQEREEQGRRDDIVLFAAITNAELLAPWLDVLEQRQVPLAGICSPALLGMELLPAAARQAPHLLLVSEHAAGIRQTYYQHGQLRFSRLAQGAASAEREAARTRQFLVGAHLLPRDSALQVLALQPLARIAAGPGAATDPLLDWRVLPLEEAAAGQRLPVTDAADTLFIGTLARHQPASHYPPGRHQRHYRLWRTRGALRASSAVLAACCMLWTIANVVGYVLVTRHAAALADEAHGYDRQYRSSMSDMPPAVDKTANMRAAVQIAQMVARQGPWPEPLMTVLSEALERSPQIRLTALDWRASVPGAAPVTASSAVPGAATTPALLAPQSSMLLGIPKAPPQQLRLQAEVLVERDNYRSVLLSMNRFAQELARTPRLAVQVEQLPFDVRPTVKLSGKAGAASGLGQPAQFVLDIRWTP